MSTDLPVRVVGAGIAGIACARVLHDAGRGVEVLERSRVCGGRMASRRTAGRPVDLGAAYFTVRDEDFGAVVRSWTSGGLAREWTDTMKAVGPDGVWTDAPGPMRYAAPAGLRSLVEDLAQGLTIRLQHTVSAVAPGPVVDGSPAAAVVLAMPDPQALAILDPALRDAVSAATAPPWKPVLALAAVYGERRWREFDALFVNGHPDLTILADDGIRRGDRAPVLVAHSTDRYAERFRAEPAQGVAGLLDAMRDVLGPIGEPAAHHVHHWSYASPGQDRSEPFHLDGDRVALTGDGWGSPRIETAWRSGTLLGRRLLELL